MQLLCMSPARIFLIEIIFSLVHVRLTLSEIQAKIEFDKDADGVVSPEEAQVC